MFLQANRLTSQSPLLLEVFSLSFFSFSFPSNIIDLMFSRSLVCSQNIFVTLFPVLAQAFQE